MTTTLYFRDLGGNEAKVNGCHVYFASDYDGSWPKEPSMTFCDSKEAESYVRRAGYFPA